MKNYQGHLNHFDRDRIEVMKDAGLKQKEIAKVLDRDPSVISREIKRNRRRIRYCGGNKDGPYRASVANHKAYVRRKYSKYQGMKIRETPELENYIISKLKLHWSPDEISGRMILENQPFYASKDLIYGWLYSVWGQNYSKYLYQKRDKKKKRKTKKSEKTIIPNRVGVEHRPKEAVNCLNYGHFEADTIVSGKSSKSKESLAVAYERKAKYINVRKIKSLSPNDFNQGMKQILNNLNKKETITFDNGFENRWHEKLGVKTYFCDPYSSWQKGGIENANKMIRRYIPKSSDISCFSHQYVTMIVQQINNKPRKSLGYRTPTEVMLENNLLKRSTEKSTKKRANMLCQKIAFGG
ncbi:MAG: putative Integrase catalytic region [Ignavibacteria bacterium]|nr:MAG: putative Integrase catalytic region [Ignavibacteria bacterium]KAF0147756.1 MAG: putative Integrase catalytic region [Ignavibacteria bacterium]